jgi:RNA polymerase sigma factor (sigma-70 family)
MEVQGFDVLPRAGRGRLDEAAWEELVRRYGSRVRVRVRRALDRYCAQASPDAVEELAQEVYCRLLEHHGAALRHCRAANERQFLAYLYRVADSAVVDRLRQARAAKRGAARLVSLSGQGSHELAERWADPGVSPEEAAVARDGYRRLMSRLRRLEGGSLGRRNLGILRLAAVDGWTSREIAGMLPERLAPSSVDSVLHRVKGRLRKACGELAPA